MFFILLTNMFSYNFRYLKTCLKIGKINYFLILLFYHKIKYIAFGFVKFYRFYNSLMVTALFALISKYRFTTNTRISIFFWWKLIIHQPLNRRKLSRPFKIINVVIFLTFKKKCIFKFCKYSFQNNEWINWNWWFSQHGLRETPSWLGCSDIHQREK